MNCRLYFPLCSLTAFVAVVNAQLAITEVMSSASTNFGSARVPSRADYWELTNYGTNTVDLTGCRFSDDGGLSDAFAGEDAAMFGSRTIHPGESVIFFQFTQNVCTNEAQFRSWWGEDRLPPNLQIYMYTGRGFSSSADAVQLWGVSGGRTILLDRVQFTEARRGFSFTYDTNSGAFGSFSGVAGGAFKAALTDDIGSPGFTAGSVPVMITRQPRDIVVDAGNSVTFDVSFTGMPEPRLQWTHNGAPISGATSNWLFISAASPAYQGHYSVQLENGITNLSSATVVLAVNTNPAPALIVGPPEDVAVAYGQTASFRVSARGYPLPAIRWWFNGVDLPGETNGILYLPNVDDAKVGTYSVRVQNAHGSAEASASLTVYPKPDLRVTEMMGSRSTNSTILGRGDWWELTNFDTNTVNLRGYRFDDHPGVLDGAVVITNDMILHPGDSALFLQDMSPELFKEWWGEENLPQNVQLFRYAGNGINAEFDTITLWNATPRNADDFITRAEYFHLNPDFTPVRGISLSFWCNGYNFFGEPSALGSCGGIRAARSEDVASPGYITNHPPRPRGLNVFTDGDGVHLTWRTETNQRYELQARDSQNAPWTSLTQHTATAAEQVLTDWTATNRSQRFYRLRLLPSPP